MGALEVAIQSYCGAADRLNVSPEGIRNDVDIVMRAFPLGRIFLHHFLNGGGGNLIIPTEGIIENDEGVKTNIQGHLFRDISSEQGIIPNNQGRYHQRNFQMAFGSLNFQWRIARRTQVENGEICIVDLWFVNRYRWHETVARISQCMHRAYTRSSGMEYDMIGKRVFYIYRKRTEGQDTFLRCDQNTPFLRELRERNQPAPHTGRDVRVIYPDSQSYFEIQ